ncbi:hypothetical protein A3C96_02765 [Candidatus Uhrbacteria bacterium RIFCSPHIGHO2_02_FULL_60_10]|uniref:Uncharacterized protein n=1 Tax=Candidatus Uhrbacteria bacterium RIFCSPHIGHO2_02_FULL_60_10 TaxID=1802392 RepID=A0A1F7U9Q1_9BACT|nr:MAG: hypothetical protein A3C96_02765 [Candidatus Uhrbacteria bacterium RIFCSPHIGHO2_02_FULL_60_10]
MSDGMTEAYRASERWRRLQNWYAAAAKFLAEPADRATQLTLLANEFTEISAWRLHDSKTKDEIRTGSLGLLSDLLAKNEAAWLTLLRRSCIEAPECFPRLKDISPFASRQVVFVETSRFSSGHLSGDVEAILKKANASRQESGSDTVAVAMVFDEDGTVDFY